VVGTLSNGDTVGELGSPLTPKPPQILHFALAFKSLQWVNFEISPKQTRSPAVARGGRPYCLI